MDDEDGFPNFNAATPGQETPTAATWNPALRPDTAERVQTRESAPESDDDFFERYPGATPKKHQPQPGISETEARDRARSIYEDDDEAVRRSSSISIEHLVDVRHDAASPEDLRDAPYEYTAEVSAPIMKHDHGEDEGVMPVDEAHDEDDAVFKSHDESVREQEQELESRMPDVPADQPEATQTTLENVETEMEAAQDEEPDAPLLEDEQAPPTPGQVSRAPTLPVSGAPVVALDGEASPTQPASKAQPAHPQIDRSFTTNFTEPPRDQGEAEVVQEPAVSAGWPAAGDDKTFGELLGDDEQPAQQSSEDAPQTLDRGDIWPTDDSGDAFATIASGKDSKPTGSGDDPWNALMDDDDDELLDESPVPDDGEEIDAQKIFGDDDELLEDDGDDFLSEITKSQAPQQPQQRSAADQYRPANAQQQQSQGRSPYQASTPLMNQASLAARSGGTPDTGLYDIYNTQPIPIPAQTPQRPGMPTAQSFADKSKGGYSSPYDLPTEIRPTRRRPAPSSQQPPSSAQAPVPPPRSSSFGHGMPPQQPPPGPSQAQQTPRPPSVSSMSPATSSQGSAVGAPPPPPPPAINGGSSARSTPKTDSGFFADLPMASKPRARPSGAYTPQPGQHAASPLPPQGRVGTPGSMAPPQMHPSRGPAPAVQPPQPQQMPQQQPQRGYGGLRQPDRMPLLLDQPAGSQQQPPAAVAPPSNRYSPAPTTTSQPATSRYSPAPASQPGQQPQPPKRFPSAGPMGRPAMAAAHNYAPRTSSPLAFADKPHPPLPAEAARGMTTSPPRLNGTQPAAMAGLSPERKGSAGSRYEPSSVPAPSYAQPPPPQGQPQRPRTQSPGATVKQAKYAGLTPLDRPTSAAGVPSAPFAQFATGVTSQPSTASAQARPGAVLPHRRQFSREVVFAAPQGERSQDPLQRWRGGPIFHWSAAGTVVTSFPKQTPFYAAGQSGPSVKCTPGDIQVREASSFIPVDERNAKFPGPLPARSKGKKKEVLAWMAGKLEDLERAAEGARMDFGMDVDLRKRVEERVLLWRIMRLFVENDGTLEGNVKIDEEVRRMLLPNLAQMSQVMELQSPVTAGGSTVLQTEPVDKQVLAQLRQALLEGQRDRAVWLAEEKKLWGHAMLIASTMGPDIWKQIIGSFVRSQVKSVGSDARSLAALYQVFAGNSEDCVDELVPPSARAGFQMVSKSDGSVSGNPLDGLDQWRETLGLVVSNRTANEAPSLLALGKLLAGYGRVEAAHTCFLFARAVVKHSGADDGEANFVLLGGNHQSQDEPFGDDLDSILLTEIYEWATSLSAPSTGVQYVPHLQAYKLVHAQQLAAHGSKNKAQSYCDHITSAYTSTTKPSGYYHPAFTQAVGEFSAFLSQTPQDGKGAGLFSRPAMKTVSSGAASWFTKFVSGDDDTSNATAGGVGGQTGSGESGPFGRVSGEISRTNSGAELYNPMMMSGGVPQQGGPAAMPNAGFMLSTAPQGRYAPSPYGGPAPKPVPDPMGAARYAPQLATGLSPVDGNQLTSPTDVMRSLGVPALDQQQRPVSAPRAGSSRYAPQQPGSSFGVQGLNMPRPDASRAASDYGVPYGSESASRRGSAQYPGSQGSYEPSPSLAQEPASSGYQPFPEPFQQQQPEAESEDAFGVRPNGMPERADFDAEVPDAEGGGGYAPPTAGYEPPSYQPYEPDPEPEQDEPQPKKKGIMDLDDDDDSAMASRAAALKKAEADRQADEAFRKAAEADAAKDKPGKDHKASGSWFGGWFKKDSSAELNKPIRAKLGEESSFYYDENLKKWVNKKGGTESATSAAATPPPPRGPASRVASSAMGPPSGPPSRVSSGAGLASMAPPGRPGTSGSGSLAPPGSGPPSRAGTPMSNPSSGPDSAGLAPPGMNMPSLNGDGSGPPSAPPSRPPTSMSTASSLDDLLAGPRKGGAGGTVKGKKKGRYVDVMAK